MLFRHVVAVVVASAPLLAQSAGQLVKSILPRYATARLNLIEAAEAMPEADYSYRLTPQQRSFGEWIDHNARMNYNLCSQAAGEPGPRMGRFSGASSKADLVEALKASFNYCDPIFQNMTDKKALSPVSAELNDVYPVNHLIGLLVNWNEHYGNLVGYLRTKGITPPSTARAQKKDAKK